MILLTKSYDLTIQMNPLKQYFHIVQFFFQCFAKWNLEMLSNFDFATFGSEGLRLWLKFTQFRTMFICLQKRSILPVNQLKLSAVCSTAVLKTFYKKTPFYHFLFRTREKEQSEFFKFFQWIFRCVFTTAKIWKQF